VAIKFDGPNPTEMKMVEATTGWKTLSGELRCPDADEKASKCHEIAVVFDKKVSYLPGAAKPSLPSAP
jgi:rubredoxin